MKLWQVLFDDHMGWRSSILVRSPYPAYGEQDALDEAADSDEGQRFVMTEADLADFKTDDERDEYCVYLGNAGQPFARENMHMREVTPQEVLESGAKLRPVNTDAEDFLKLALEEEHYDRSDGARACDICAAMEAGYYLWAAHILVGATECPLTESAYEWIREGRSAAEQAADLDKERVELLESVDHKTCPSCNSVNWGDYLENCGNCLAVFPQEEEEEA